DPGFDSHGPHGPFETRYLAFLETIPHIRPRLHRYCARMTGSVMDGEDIVQETLFQAYRKLETFDDTRDLTPWLFRIAHNRCIDLLRRRKVRQQAEAAAVQPDVYLPPDPSDPIPPQSIEHLVLALAPKERACVLLKDVFDHSLEEIASLTGSTVGAVKAALSRGRSKLAALPRQPATKQVQKPEVSRLLHLYVERFNQRDWDGIRELATADAQIHVADRYAGPLASAPYFGRYEHLSTPWRMATGTVDGEPVILTLRQHNGQWTAHSIVRAEIEDDRILRIVDYSHCPWVLATVSSTIVDPF
ncbi:MAG TPA: sigma-70 family RNA polymerase sigma factor, partial [Edaphobacter sp.]